MKLSNVLLVASGASAQSLCDKYTTALLTDNTAANQQTLLTLLVNTVVIGNYTQPNVGVSVPGILAPTEYMGQYVNLLPYFNGGLASSNRGGSCGVVVNFLDGGGAAPLMQNMPADSASTNQYGLLTHLYEFFAALLGCSQYGNTVSPYAGFNGMYEVHKFMALSSAEVGWFIENVGLAAASFGVSSEDVQTVAAALTDTFSYRCSPAASVPSYEPPALQAICTECDCPIAANANCEGYGPIIEPQPASQASSNCGWGYQCKGSYSWSWDGHNWGWHWVGRNHDW